MEKGSIEPPAKIFHAARLKTLADDATLARPSLLAIELSVGDFANSMEELFAEF